jgi:hypothetical protein
MKKFTKALSFSLIISCSFIVQAMDKYTENQDPHHIFGKTTLSRKDAWNCNFVDDCHIFKLQKPLMNKIYEHLTPIELVSLGKTCKRYKDHIFSSLPIQGERMVKLFTAMRNHFHTFYKMDNLEFPLQLNIICPPYPTNNGKHKVIIKGTHSGVSHKGFCDTNEKREGSVKYSENGESITQEIMVWKYDSPSDLKNSSLEIWVQPKEGLKPFITIPCKMGEDIELDFKITHKESIKSLNPLMYFNGEIKRCRTGNISFISKYSINVDEPTFYEVQFAVNPPSNDRTYDTRLSTFILLNPK